MFVLREPCNELRRRLDNVVDWLRATDGARMEWKRVDGAPEGAVDWTSDGAVDGARPLSTE